MIQCFLNINIAKIMILFQNTNLQFKLISITTNTRKIYINMLIMKRSLFLIIGKIHHY